ncbi:hypothetical protein [Sunxiuqinia rutila]|uniref:hypothetical protein n=1 Tax=Sunxiuqinia rutila TaxID=1397841 RepID=UPI003D35CB92
MNIKNLAIILSLLIFSSCASIPKEVVSLSQTLGEDLKILHKSHINAVGIYFDKMEEQINTFVDKKYAPFVIHYVLSSELQSYKTGTPSLYGTIEIAGQKEGEKEANDALAVMMDFQEAARSQIETKREDLLSPLEKQKSEILNAVNQSYESAVYANSSITAYLKSLRKVKESQQEALSMVGLSGVDTKITESMSNLSEQIERAVQKGKEIDVKSDDAYQQLEEVSNQIKKIIN